MKEGDLFTGEAQPRREMEALQAPEGMEGRGSTTAMMVTLAPCVIFLTPGASRFNQQSQFW
jgi:hypothetical protein